MILEVLGYGLGLALWIPGGLFEVALAVLLIMKGFPAGQSRDHEGQTPVSSKIPEVVADR